MSLVTLTMKPEMARFILWMMDRQEVNPTPQGLKMAADLRLFYGYVEYQLEQVKEVPRA